MPAAISRRSGKKRSGAIDPSTLGFRAFGTNPAIVESVTESKVKRRERLLSGAEIGALMMGLDATERDITEHRCVATIHAVILTGARISELLTSRWRDIRCDEVELHLADTRTGMSRRPISAPALAMLDNVERMPGLEFVFHASERRRRRWPTTRSRRPPAAPAGEPRSGAARCTLSATGSPQ
jgi:integrase